MKVARIALLFTFIFSSTQLFAEASFRSKKYPVIFMPSVSAGYGLTNFNSTIYQTYNADAGMLVAYLKNSIIVGAQANYTYTVIQDDTQEAFRGGDIAIIAGTYYKTHMKLWFGYAPYTELTSQTDSSLYRGTGFRAGMSFALTFPLQLVISAKQMTYDRRILNEATTKLGGDLKLITTSYMMGLAYEF